jgi:ubiquinone/menaquinone biosynthesis C-methylase UbiE
MKKEYYATIKKYYNDDAKSFMDRCSVNSIISKLRYQFRLETDQLKVTNSLEIGCGAGMDLEYFARKNKEANFYGIDVSENMIGQTLDIIKSEHIPNITVKVGSIENIKDLFEGQKFDHIYVHFGALNTVENIEEIQHYLKEVLTEDGRMVFSFVNKWYLMAILKPLLKLRIKAFKHRSRLGKVWGGYSLTNFIKSRCYSSREIKKFFNEFEIEKKQGFCILYPAWYESKLTEKYPKMTNFFWKVDLVLQKTIFWNLGEYSLYVFKNKR